MNIPNIAIEVQEGIFWAPHKYGSELIAKEGYHFYLPAVTENYDENGNLKPGEERIWCTYMSCVYDNAEDALQHIVAEKIN